jgi:phage gp29-like protein
MRRDPVLMGALRGVQIPVAQLSWHITPDDETDPAESEAAKLMTYIIERVPKLQTLKMQLLEAVWFGKYAVEVEYEWRNFRGEEKLFVRSHHPVNGDKLRYKWDGTPGILVYAGFPGTREATDQGLCHFLTPDERLGYLIHEFEPDDADWTEPEMAGSIHGVGVRGRLYWFWWLKQQVFAQLMNYLHRFANGLTIFYYQAGNPEAKREAEVAARQQFSNTSILYPRWNSENPDLNSVQRLEVGTANSNLLWNLVSEYFDDIMVRYIQGQDLSSKAEATGLGSGVADLHGDTLDTRIKYLAIGLQETLQTDLVDVLYSYNAPGVHPGRFEMEVDSPDSEKLMAYGQQLYEWGVPLDEDQAYKLSQWQKPKPGGGIITNVGAMSPAAVGGVPQGVPVSGAAGPQDPTSGMTPPQAPPPQQMSRRAKRDYRANQQTKTRLPQRQFSVSLAR